MTKNNQEESRQKKKIISILKLILLFGIIFGIPALIFFYHPNIFEEFRNLEQLNAFLEHYKTASIFVYIGLQIIQILISVIPGQMLQFAAGYMYLFLPALLLSLIGIGLGTILTFQVARLLGRDAMYVFFKEEKVHYFVQHLNSKKAYIIIFLLFLLPGFPKDFITYVAGVSEIKMIPFLILSLVGRTPALMMTLLMGNMTRVGSYKGAIIMIGIATFLFLLCFLKRKKIMEFCDDAYEKLSK